MRLLLLLLLLKQTGTSVATLPGTWHYRVSTGTGQPGVSMCVYTVGEVESLICDFYVSVAARKIGPLSVYCDWVRRKV